MLEPQSWLKKPATSKSYLFMPPSPFLNAKRLRDYPRLVLGVEICILGFNALLGEGWMGALKQIIGSDFIMLYSGGLLYRQDLPALYDFLRQGEIQKELLAPTPFWGIMPYNYPPYAAMAASALTHLPLPLAFGLWTLLTIVAVLLAARWLYQYLTPEWLKQAGLTYPQLLVLTFSFFPFIEGLQVGQNHGLTLLLVAGATAFTLRGSGFLAGILAGLLIYKPQFVLGFLIVWLAWGKFKPLAGFLVASMSWAGSFALLHGLAPYQEYLANLPLLLKMPYLEGFGGYLEVTLYGLLITILPPAWWQGIWTFTQLSAILLGLALGAYARLTRKDPRSHQKPALILAILYPLLVSPHTLLHDLVILVPLFLLWADADRSRRLLYLCAGIYLAVLFLPPITHTSGIALLALIPLILAIRQVRQLLKAG